MEKANNVFKWLAMDSYEEWYKKDVAPHLTKEQKEAVVHRISDQTLYEPIWLDRETNFIEQYPELKPYSHSGKISGLQLLAVMDVIFAELHPEQKISLRDSLLSQ